MKEDRSFICDNCGKFISTEEQLYLMNIELFASPDLPEITSEELLKDHIEEMKKIIHSMDHLEPEELEDQVFESYTFHLCPSCRNDFHIKLKNRFGKNKL